MTSQIDIKPILETEGSGIVSFKDGTQTSAEFQLRLLLNGTLEGEIIFPATFTKYFEITFDKSIKRFELKGNATIWKRKEQIFLSDCYLTSFEFTLGQSDTMLKSKFVAHMAVVNTSAETFIPYTELLINFDIINMFETFRVIVDTPLGELRLAHGSDIKELERMMTTYNIPLITSSIMLKVTPNGSKTLLQILSEATNIVEGFLKITSLSQGSWHDWVSISVYEKLPEGDIYERRYLKMSTPKQKMPAKREITVQVHSQNFIKSAWNGYSKELDEKYGFDRALEWYVEANLATVLESQFLSATTCLELLMERYHSSTDSEYLLEEHTFEELRQKLEDIARQWMKEKGVDEEIRSIIYRALKGINRRQYVDKATRLLKYWHIKVDDLKVTIEDIVHIRNQITHKGRVEKNDNLFGTYQALMMMLVRIFLAMLNYNEQYYDLARGEWIKFPEISSRT